jgi:hypothetical protein
MTRAPAKTHSDSSPAKNPENDPAGVDLENLPTIYISSINLVVCSFPSLETFSLDLIGFATLPCVYNALEETRINLA